MIFECVVGFGNNLYIDDLEFSVLSDTREISNISNDISIFPNPTNGIFSIKLNDIESIQSYDILNIHGLAVYAANVVQDSSSNQIDLNLDSLPKGIYFIRMNIGNQFISKKVILK